MSATSTERPLWLTATVLRRLEELAINDTDLDAEFLLATEQDDLTLAAMATRITGNTGRICMTEKGRELVAEFGTIEAPFTRV